LTPATSSRIRALFLLTGRGQVRLNHGKLAHAALVALSDPIALSGKADELAELCTEASKSFGATNLPISQHVQKLVQSATKN